jgi:hypothetical protein
VLFPGAKVALKLVSQEYTPELVTMSPGSTPTFQRKRLRGRKLWEMGKGGRRDELKRQVTRSVSHRLRDAESIPNTFVVWSVGTYSIEVRV